MKFLVIVYNTPLKMLVENRQYFNDKDDICEYLNISRNQLENFMHNKIKGKRRSLNILQRVDIFRKYQYDMKSIEKKIKIGVQDFEEILKYVKDNLKKIKELKEALKSVEH